MQVVLNNVDNTMLSILENLKTLAPNLQIIKEPCVYSDDEIKTRIEEGVQSIENGTAKLYTFDEMKQKFSVK
ncbi:hypothetical protein [Campylobacter suis]|uniref:Uncharacterized protein n=1 Tax=Campylobacter suis TaxID=2790657 RepID=A0ABM8Q7X2_9BACT|nr:hypothetical protein [Campylobacter suis]CAD7289043.1 hypothetical protein LMG8286_01628 [Campylobacter suis]